MDRGVVTQGPADDAPRQRSDHRVYSKYMEVVAGVEVNLDQNWDLKLKPGHRRY